jgi:tripartite-type tricarboxylate transporter receptor subunit TctC
LLQRRQRIPARFVRIAAGAGERHLQRPGAFNPHRVVEFARHDFERKILGMVQGMKLPRRRFLSLAASGVALPALLRSARADSYPSRPIHLLVGFPPGGAADIIARLTGQMLSERLGQPFVVENRGSAGQQIAAEAVVKAEPDGYTLLLMANPNVINAMLNPNLSFNFTRDLAPVGGVDLNPLILEVNPSLPVHSVPELIAYAKAHPAQINMASGGVGSTPHLAGELFKMMTGINMLHVPYRGDAPAITDLLAGQDQVMFDLILLSLSHIRSGALRGLAVTSAKRLPALPDLPPVADFVPGYEAFAWQGVAAPKDTPPKIVAKLNSEINAALADAKIASRLTDLGGVPMPMTPAAFGQLIASEVDKWGKVIKFANIKTG